LGEIADALKKAHAERDSASEPSPRRIRRDADRDADAVARGWSGEPPPEPARSPSAEPPAPRESRPSEPAPSPDTETLPALQLDGETPRVDHTRHLALRIKTEMERRSARSVLVASALRNEGKTTVSCNLAIALASVSSGRGIALVDLDLRNPSVCKRLGLPASSGIDEAILGKIRLEQACHSLGEPRIDVYPASKPRPAAHELLAGDGFRAIMEELHARYELVVIDSPPTLLVPDSTLILRHADACVTVAHAGITRVRMFKKMLETLPADRIIGKVLNAAPTEKHQRDYYAYGYGADEGSESRPEDAAS